MTFCTARAAAQARASSALPNIVCTTSFVEMVRLSPRSNPASIIARVRGIDLRSVGSGNPGATNAGRAKTTAKSMLMPTAMKNSPNAMNAPCAAA